MRFFNVNELDLTKKLNLVIAPDSFQREALRELEFKNLTFFKTKVENHLIVEGDLTHFWWSKMTVKNLNFHNVKSISDAQDYLKSKKKYWVSINHQNYRRQVLVEREIPCAFNKKDVWSLYSKLGAWFFLDENTIGYGFDFDPIFSNGLVPIKEDLMAPSKAYQKITELFSRLGKFPILSDTIIELGSHPGGWTWVLCQLSQTVISVDTVELDKKLQQFVNLNFVKKDAFKLDVIADQNISWFFSDIICEPEKLYELVQKWKKNTNIKNWICTLKFKGHCNFETIQKFQDIPNSKILHLNSNKHELMWVNVE